MPNYFQIKEAAQSERAKPRSQQRGVGRRPKSSSLKWAIKQLEQMAKEETDPKLKALWLRAQAAGYDRLTGTVKPSNSD